MATEIDLWVVLPLCLLGFLFWAGMYVYITLTVIRHDPKEIQYRKESGKNLGILPDKLGNQKNRNM